MTQASLVISSSTTGMTAWTISQHRLGTKPDKVTWVGRVCSLLSSACCLVGYNQACHDPYLGLPAAAPAHLESWLEATGLQSYAGVHPWLLCTQAPQASPHLQAVFMSYDCMSAVDCKYGFWFQVGLVSVHTLHLKSFMLSSDLVEQSPASRGFWSREDLLAVFYNQQCVADT